MNPLRGRRVLVTRPAAQNRYLLDGLRQRGAEAIALPLFDIEALPDDNAQRDALRRAQHWDGWIFTSRNAVARVAALHAGAWPALFAIGGATARALAEHARHAAQAPPQGSTSEDLLAHPALRDVHGRRFLVCTGVGGRDLLAPALRARGAQAERLDLYRRVAIEHAPELLRARLAALDAVVCTSGEGLARLHAIAPPPLRPALHAALLVTPSTRVVELARRLGFLAPLAPAQMSDDALIECLERGLAETARAANPPS